MNKIKSLRGIHDILPKDLFLWWNKIENIIKKILKNYSYNEIRVPILEKTNLFNRSIGNNTDIINKEMYNFKDKNGCSITLRPEATVSCVRSIIQNNLLHNNILKLWYYGPMFRYERPQKGRFRQFNQIGAEIYGSNKIELELEIFLLITRFLKILKINNFVTLEINSIGSLEERLIYQKDLNKFFKKKKKYLDKNIINKIKYNNLKILDSKNIKIKKILYKSPILKNYFKNKTIHNFNILCSLLKKFNIPYKINYNLVRGLDYYNDIVFEWKTNKLGSQNTICSGGRYDTLFTQLGNKFHVPALGFAIGLERLILLFKKINKQKKKKKINIFISFIKQRNKILAIKLSEKIHTIFPNLTIIIDTNINVSKNKKKYFSKLNIDLILFIGDKERKNNFISVKQCKKKKKIIVFKKNIFLMIQKFFKK